MRKYLLALIFALGMFGVTTAQTGEKSKMKVKAKTVTMAKSDSSVTTVKGKMKKDGTPDMRFKENKKVKKDGTPDMRYKQNKKMKKDSSAAQ
jgi:hypothetical protein